MGEDAQGSWHQIPCDLAVPGSSPSKSLVSQTGRTTTKGFEGPLSFGPQHCRILTSSRDTASLLHFPLRIESAVALPTGEILAVNLSLTQKFSTIRPILSLFPRDWYSQCHNSLDNKDARQIPSPAETLRCQNYVASPPMIAASM